MRYKLLLHVFLLLVLTNLFSATWRPGEMKVKLDNITPEAIQEITELGIEIDFNPPRTPHFKGTVESFFDTLNDLLLSGLPGRTFRSWERRADYDPDAGPLIPYEALLEIGEGGEVPDARVAP